MNGNADALRSSIPSPRYDGDIVAHGGTLSIYDSSSVPLDYQTFIEQARANHDVRLDKQGYPNVSTPQPWGTPDSPMNVYAKGDYVGHRVDIDERPIVGAGILVIDGSLEVADQNAVLHWQGFVIVRSNVNSANATTNDTSTMTATVTASSALTSSPPHPERHVHVAVHVTSGGRATRIRSSPPGGRRPAPC